MPIAKTNSDRSINFIANNKNIQLPCRTKKAFLAGIGKRQAQNQPDFSGRALSYNFMKQIPFTISVAALTHYA